jgi:hypothetical protein
MTYYTARERVSQEGRTLITIKQHATRTAMMTYLSARPSVGETERWQITEQDAHTLAQAEVLCPGALFV